LSLVYLVSRRALGPCRIVLAKLIIMFLTRWRYRYLA